jgi:hypothetical protein
MFGTRVMTIVVMGVFKGQGGRTVKEYDGRNVS